ncbi:MAG: hypothetical protein WCG98_10590 [bacterium]
MSPAIPQTASQATNQDKSIQMMYLSLAPTYRHIINQTIPRIITVHRSGMRRKIKNNIAFNTMNEIKNPLSLTILSLLNSHDHKKNTYPSLKNSAGWILGKNGILIHHLAPLSVTPMPGINTDNCSTIKTTAMMIIVFCF